MVPSYIYMPTVEIRATNSTTQEPQKEGTSRLHKRRFHSLPAKVEERPAGFWDVLVEPGQEVKLSDGPRLVGLHVL